MNSCKLPTYWSKINSPDIKVGFHRTKEEKRYIKVVLNMLKFNITSKFVQDTRSLLSSADIVFQIRTCRNSLWFY